MIRGNPGEDMYLMYLMVQCLTSIFILLDISTSISAVMENVHFVVYYFKGMIKRGHTEKFDKFSSDNNIDFLKILSEMTFTGKLDKNS